MTDKSIYTNRFFYKLFQQVDNSPLIIFRILFGFLLCWHTVIYISNGSVYNIFIEPPFTFTFIGFEFLQPLPGNGMYYYFGVMAALAILIMLGAWYRLAMTGFAILWTLQYLMQKSGYNNHYYLILLLCWVMAVVPANRNLSVDVKRKPQIKSLTCPQWVTWLFASQIAIIYLFAALSKLNVDWFSGKFLAIQFSRLSMHPIYGILYGQSWFPGFIAFSGFIFDLLIIPLLCWKKSRPIAFYIFCCFHLFNAFSFRIGIFPFLSIALAIFFFPPEKIRSIFLKTKLIPVDSKEYFVQNSIKKNLVGICLCCYIFLQIAIPMRPWFYPGNTFWTEEGYRMSWKMMLRSKTGTVYFKVIDPLTGHKWIVDPGNSFSAKHVMWVAISPDITWQYAQRIKKNFELNGLHNVEVYAISSVKLNRNKPAPLTDTTINLAQQKWYPFRHSTWITDYKY